MKSPQEEHTTEALAQPINDPCANLNSSSASAAAFRDVIGPESQGGMQAKNGKMLIMDASGVSKLPPRRRERLAANMMGSSTDFSLYPYMIDTPNDR